MHQIFIDVRSNHLAYYTAKNFFLGVFTMTENFSHVFPVNLLIKKLEFYNGYPSNPTRYFTLGQYGNQQSFYIGLS